MLFRHLTSLGEKHIVTGDYSSFGDVLQSQCIVAAFQIMRKWYDHHYGHDAVIDSYRDIICQELLHVTHLADRKLYKMFCGIPSGFALTVELNSIDNCLYQRIAWQWIMQSEPKLKSLVNFGKLTRCVTYGDDLILAVSKEISHLFNFHTISAFLALHNIAFTSSDKDNKNPEAFMHIAEASFLKRTFVQHPFRKGCIVAPLDEESVKDCINWVHNTRGNVDAALENSRAVIENAYSLGEEKHNDIRKKIVEWWARNHNMKLDCETWSSIDHRVWDVDGFKFSM
jgi:hypothetical protein